MAEEDRDPKGRDRLPLPEEVRISVYDPSPLEIDDKVDLAVVQGGDPFEADRRAVGLDSSGIDLFPLLEKNINGDSFVRVVPKKVDTHQRNEAHRRVLEQKLLDTVSLLEVILYPIDGHRIPPGSQLAVVYSHRKDLSSLERVRF